MDSISRYLKSIRWHVLIICIMVVVLVYLFPISLSFLLNNFSRIRYNMNFGDLNPGLWLYVIYCLVSYNLNIITLNECKMQSWSNIMIQTFIDILIVPLSVLLIIINNNNKSQGLVDYSKLINFWIIGILLISKHIVILVLKKRFFVRT